MLISKIEQLNKSKFKIYIDDNYAFLLYTSDIKKYLLEEGRALSEECYYDILKNTIIRRAKQKALSLLGYSDRTSHELVKKLMEDGYTEEIALQALSYVSEYGYVNDERYTASYIKNNKEKKSKSMIYNELSHKGINKEIIDKIILSEYLEGEEENAEITALRKAIHKKTKHPENLSFEEKQKLIAYLYRRGFSVEDIKKEINYLT